MCVMERQNSKGSWNALGVKVDPVRGVVFYRDISCCTKCFHSEGFMNVYSVVLVYKFRGRRQYKSMRLDYGEFTQANNRYLMEISSESTQPESMDVKEVRLIVTTFDGTRLVHEDVMRKATYDSDSTQDGDVC